MRDASLTALARALATARAGGRFYAYLNSAELVGLGLILIVGFFAVAAGDIEVGADTTAALYFHGLFNPIGGLLSQLDTVHDAGASLARLVGVLSLDRTVDSPVGDPGDGVRVRDVGYDYEAGHPVLRGVSLQVPPARRMVLVGESGAGKTTLVKLVAGLRQPSEGLVEVGARPQGAVTQPSTWVDSVSQEVHVFAGTVADNLSLGRPDADEATLESALRAVGAHAWVHALPQGPATVVGEGGHQLTVAQAQHLALVRLWLARAPVVILDEATAEAGSAASRDLERAALAAMRGRNRPGRGAPAQPGRGCRRDRRADPRPSGRTGHPRRAARQEWCLRDQLDGLGRARRPTAALTDGRRSIGRPAVWDPRQSLHASRHPGACPRHPGARRDLITDAIVARIDT